MSLKLRKALSTVFILGIGVSFSSLIFLVFFFNFSSLPSVYAIISVVICFIFQLAAYVGGVVLEKKIWPSILCILPCSIGTAWAGIVGPGSVFGMPETLIGNAEKFLSSPLYIASLPVTLMGIGVGILYFIVGAAGLLRDSALTQQENPDSSSVEPVDKSVIFNHVSELLRSEETSDEEAVGSALETNSDVDTEDTLDLAVETADEDLPIDPLSAAQEEVEEICSLEPDNTNEESPASIDEKELAFAPEEESGAPASDTNEPEPSAPGPPSTSLASRILARISAFFAIEQHSTSSDIPALETAELAVIEDADFIPDSNAEFAETTLKMDSCEEKDVDVVDIDLDSSENVTAEQLKEEESLAANSVEPAESLSVDELPKEELEEEPSKATAESPEDLIAAWNATSYQPVPPQDLSVTIETQRLRIMRLNSQAFSALLRGIEDMEEEIGLTPSGELLDSPTLDTFDSLYSQAIKDAKNYKWFAVWVIVSRDENKLLGSAGFKGKPAKNGTVSLGCGVNDAHRQSNYQGEAILALCEWAVMQEGVASVVTQTDLSDLDSSELLEKSGFTRVKETSRSFHWRLDK